jgi:thiosulfate dehydrogenase [quinone] large subunit
VLTIAAAGLAAILVDRIPGLSVSAALARGFSAKFRPPSHSRKVGNIKKIPPNSALALRDPATRRPAVIMRLTPAKKLTAYSAVCTHAGCTVSYHPARALLLCPCHGSAFDPSQGAAVVAGPAPAPLPAIKVAVDPKGNIYMV